MPFTYPQVTIGGTSYNSYVNLADADAYLNGSVDADAWNALSDDAKGRAIITAVRLIDRQGWKGEKTEADNALAWPRTCMDGDPPGTLPAALVTATIQLAYAVSQDETLASMVSTSQGETRRLKAGSVEIEYFNSGVSSALAAGRTIANILSALADCLAGGSGLTGFGGAYSSGTDCKTAFKPGYGVTQGF